MAHNIERIQIVSAKYTAPMHRDYLFENKKVYVESPERTIVGNMVFGEKFFVPYFTVSWNYLPIEQFNALMKVSETDEETVRYFDSFSNEYKVGKFAIQQPKYSRLHFEKGKIVGAVGIEMVFDGTLNDIATISVSFDLNGGYGSTPATIVGYQGEDVVLPAESTSIVPPNGYKISSWNTKADGSGTKYAVGGWLSLSANITLYAIYEPSTSYVLSFDYGVADAEKDSDGNDITQKTVSYGTVVGALPTPVLKKIKYNGEEMQEPYTFNGWYTIVNNNGTGAPQGTQYTANTVYNVQKNITLHAFLQGVLYYISFSSNGGTIVDSITQQYNLPIYEPKEPTRTGYKFVGWYTDNGTFNSKFTFNKMPPANVQLYAKWERE